MGYRTVNFMQKLFCNKATLPPDATSARELFLTACLSYYLRIIGENCPSHKKELLEPITHGSNLIREFISDVKHFFRIIYQII